MYDSDRPTRAELPSARQLVRSTAIAAGVAAALLAAVVLPAEYAIDPTGVGRVLGLTEMGEIKMQLAREAEADRLQDRAPAPAPVPERGSSLVGRVFAALLVGPAQAQTPSSARAQEVSLTLAPAEGVEVKMDMREGAKATYGWTATGGGVNYDLHGSPASGTSERSYKRGRGERGDQGVVTAAFDGAHGWFWRNRTREPVTVTLTVSGDFANLKRVK